MGLYILLAIISCLLSITFFKKYYWEGETLYHKKQYLWLSMTLFGVAFPFGLTVILVYGIKTGGEYLCEKLVKLLDKV